MLLTIAATSAAVNVSEVASHIVDIFPNILSPMLDQASAVASHSVGPERDTVPMTGSFNVEPTDLKQDLRRGSEKKSTTS